jgi:serine/threonine protein kinase
MKGLTHRDIKPDNLHGKDQRVQIPDFGLAEQE